MSPWQVRTPPTVTRETVRARAPRRIGHYESWSGSAREGMAEAFRARARGPGGYERQLIVKCILPALADNPEFVRLFVAEAKILGMLNHPNIVQVYDFGEHDRRHFLALEYLDGPSVNQIGRLLRRARTPMPIGVAAYIAREMCLGLAAAHGLRGPLRRAAQRRTPGRQPFERHDDDRGRGEAGGLWHRAHGSAEPRPPRAGTIRGKPAYMSPRADFLSAPVDRRADIFTTGVVLHEMLTCVPLFQADNDLATIYRVTQLPIARPSTQREEVPTFLDRIVMRALQRAPEARYQSAGDMAVELSAFLSICPVGREDIAALAITYNLQRQRGSAPTQPVRRASPALRNDLRPPRSRSRWPPSGRRLPVAKGVTARGAKRRRHRVRSFSAGVAPAAPLTAPVSGRPFGAGADPGVVLAAHPGPEPRAVQHAAEGGRAARAVGGVGEAGGAGAHVWRAGAGGGARAGRVLGPHAGRAAAADPERAVRQSVAGLAVAGEPALLAHEDGPVAPEERVAVAVGERLLAGMPGRALHRDERLAGLDHGHADTLEAAVTGGHPRPATGLAQLRPRRGRRRYGRCGPGWSHPSGS